jgi:hypothetical protein
VGTGPPVEHPVRRSECEDLDPAAGYSAAGTYNADVYVFAVETATDHAAYDPLDLEQ